MECDEKIVCHNSPGNKEEGVLPCAEMFSRDAEEEEDLVMLQNPTLLLRLSAPARKDVIVDPGRIM